MRIVEMCFYRINVTSIPHPEQKYILMKHKIPHLAFRFLMHGKFRSTECQ